jgi:hypothetical protein
MWSNMAKSLTLLRSGGTSDDLDKLARDDSLASAVEQNLELVDHVTSVLGRILQTLALWTTASEQTSLTSIAFRRADCSQAWPSASA